jgi:hypothetical protein
MITSTPVYAPAFRTPQGSGVSEAGDVIANLLGTGLRVRAGANGKLVQNAGPLVAGTLIVANTAVTADSLIVILSRGNGGAVGFLVETRAARVAGVSFTVLSSNGADVQNFDYLIVEPA